MQISSFLSGKYLSAADIGDENVTVTIISVESEIVGRDGDKKLVVGFGELDKKLVLNVTNLKALARFGGDTDDWINKRGTLRTVETSYAGEPRMGIRVAPAAVVAAVKRKRAGGGGGAVAPSLADELDDKIPF